MKKIKIILGDYHGSCFKKKKKALSGLLLLEILRQTIWMNAKEVDLLKTIQNILKLN